jgi:hypothetical protein
MRTRPAGAASQVKGEGSIAMPAPGTRAATIYCQRLSLFTCRPDSGEVRRPNSGNTSADEEKGAYSRLHERAAGPAIMARVRHDLGLLRARCAAYFETLSQERPPPRSAGLSPEECALIAAWLTGCVRSSRAMP